MESPTSSISGRESGMNKCPQCGHEWPAENQKKGGKARWKGTTKTQRSKAASDAAKARWAAKKAK